MKFIKVNTELIRQSIINFLEQSNLNRTRVNSNAFALMNNQMKRKNKNENLKKNSGNKKYKWYCVIQVKFCLAPQVSIGFAFS